MGHVTDQYFQQLYIVPNLSSKCFFHIFFSATKSQEDVAKVLEIDSKPAGYIYDIVLTRAKMNPLVMVPDEMIEFAAEAINLFAELGIFTLPN